MNTVYNGLFTYQSNIDEYITSTANSKSRCKDGLEYVIDKDGWSLFIEDITVDNDDKIYKLILEYHTFPCLHCGVLL